MSCETKVGPAGHSEYDWSSITEEQLVQLFFQLNRTNNYKVVCEKFGDLLETLFWKDEKPRKKLQRILIKILLHTRDIIAGKGEYDLFYHLIGTFSKVLDKYPGSVKMMLLLRNIILTTVHLEDHRHPYGSWKDMKYILNHLKHIYGESNLIQKEIFKYIITLIVGQLQKDVQSSGNISLVGKWAPREKSKKFGWQAKYIARAYFNDTDIPDQVVLANYRRVISNLNKKGIFVF